MHRRRNRHRNWQKRGSRRLQEGVRSVSGLDKLAIVTMLLREALATNIAYR